MSEMIIRMLIEAFFASATSVGIIIAMAILNIKG